MLGSPGLEKDYGKAAKYLTIRAEQGDTSNLLNLGNLYVLGGNNLQQDFEKAREWWIKSALLNEIDAQKNLGALYFNGDSVQKDYREAAKWFLQAAPAGRCGRPILLSLIHI